MKMFLSFCLLTLTVYHISALECYNCITGCNDEFKPEGISKVDCNGSCMKTKSGDNVIRNCMPLLDMDECEKENDVEVCLCNTNLCNGATRDYMSTFCFITTVACIVLNAVKNNF